MRAEQVAAREDADGRCEREEEERDGGAEEPRAPGVATAELDGVEHQREEAERGYDAPRRPRGE